MSAIAARLPQAGRVRVGVDGRTAVGKTTFADALADHIRATGRPVVRAGIDGFHRPKAERYARGRMSAEGYYRDARDLEAVRRHLLDPFGPGGDGRYAVKTFDLATDTAVQPVPTQAPENAVLVVDGSFLQRRKLRGGLDMVVFLRASRETSRARGVARDGAYMAEAYDRRYLPAFDLYTGEVDPVASADVVVDVEDWSLLFVVEETA